MKEEIEHLKDINAHNLVLALQACNGKQCYAALECVPEENLKHMGDMIKHILEEE